MRPTVTQGHHRKYSRCAEDEAEEDHERLVEMIAEGRRRDDGGIFP